VEAAMQAEGVALVPVSMFARELESGNLVRPFATEITLGSYWLTRLKSKRMSSAMQVFDDWISRELPLLSER